MGRASPALASFNGGEFSPQMEGRTDIDKYVVAAHVQQNFIALKQGPAMFRPGTAYVQPVKASANRTWLAPFEFSATQAYIIEFGDGYARFYTDNGPLLSTGNAAYNGATTYAIGDQAVQAGICYYCIAPTVGNAPPNATYWYPMAQYNGSATVAIYEIPTAYAAADLINAEGSFALQIVQSGDVLYIAGGTAGAGYQPKTLTRYANAPPKWIMSTFAPTDGPYSPGLALVPNGNIWLTASAEQGQAITLKAYGGNVFAATDVGRLVRLASQTYNTQPWVAGEAGINAGDRRSNNGNNYIALNAATAGASPPFHIEGAVIDGKSGVWWLYTDSGYGICQITAYTSATQVTAKVLKRLPINVVGTALAITNITQAVQAVVSCVNTSAVSDPVFITGVTGMTQVNGNSYVNAVANAANITLAGIDSTGFTAYGAGGTIVVKGSLNWQLGAWSSTTEWPRACAFFKDRLFWAGKLNVWGSVPGLYDSHAPDEFGQQLTTSAINLTVTGTDASSIAWLSSAIILLVGTEGGEFGIDAANYSTAPLGPANVECLRQSGWRCRHIKPELIGTSLLYWQRASRKLLGADFNFANQRYDSEDQSKYSYHMTIGGVTGHAYQQEPNSTLWATRADGTLLSYTYNREDNVTAWCRHNLGGAGIVESLAVIPAPDGTRDQLWMIVRRTINGATVRYVEYLSKHYEGPQAGNPGDAQADAWYLDAGAVALNTPAPGDTTTTITGLGYLIGQTVGFLADGGKQPQQVVPSSGEVTLAGAFSKILVGLPYQGNLVPMRPEGGADVGTAQGKLKQGANLSLRMVDSLGGLIGQFLASKNDLGGATIVVGPMDDIRLNDTATELDEPPAIYSGDVPLSFPHNPEQDRDASDFYILVQQNDPFPMTIAGIYPSYKVEERQ